MRGTRAVKIRECARIEGLAVKIRASETSSREKQLVPSKVLIMKAVHPGEREIYEHDIWQHSFFLHVLA